MKDTVQRLEYIDVLKGLLIIFVVFGHSSFRNSEYSNYIYWFHMPAFFIISGYLFSDIKSIEQLKEKIFSRTKSYLVPYFSYGLIFALSSFFILNLQDSSISIGYLLTDFGNLIYGGSILRGPYAVFWFINVLYLTSIVFFLINYLKPKRSILFGSILALYLLIHLFYNLGWVGNKNIAWNIEAIPVAFFFMYIGYFIRIENTAVLQKKNIFLIFSTICFLFLLLSEFGLIDYEFNMKYSQFNSPILTMIIPTIFTYTLIQLCKIIEKTKLASILKILGQYTIIIYFLHFPINQYLTFFTSFQYGTAMYLALGLILPLLIGKIISYNKHLSFLFLGKSPSKIKQ